MLRDRWMWVGSGGGVLLAAAAWLAGALPGGDPAAFSVPYVSGLACWVAGGVSVSWAWLRWTGTPWLAALWALPLTFSPPLGSRDVYAYACQGWLWLHGLDPYRVGVAPGGCPWVEAVPHLWWETPAPYGPLAIAASGLAAATGSQLGALIVLRLIAIGGAALVAWQLPRLTARRDVLMVGVITPLVAIHGISGAHNDLVMAGAVVAALVAGRSSSPARAGLWLAAAVAVKVTALVALPFVLILLGRRWWIALTTAAAAFAALSLATGLDLGWLNALRHTGELVQWSSVPTAVGMTFGYLLGPAAVTVARAIGLIVLAGLAVAAWRAAWRGRAPTAPRGGGPRREPTRGQPPSPELVPSQGSAEAVLVACGGLMAAAALLGPVFYPWYAIGALAVLAVTGLPRSWLATATLICAFLALPNGHGIPAMTKAPGAVAVTGILIVVLVRKVRAAGGVPHRRS